MPKKEVVFNKKFIHEICVEVYKERLDHDDLYSIRNGKIAHEREICRLQQKHGPKIGMEKFEENAQIYRTLVEDAAVIIKQDIKEKGVSKKSKTDKKRIFKPEYVYDVCLRIYNMRAKRDEKIAEMLKMFRKKYGSEERALKRFGDKAQILAPPMRAVLKAFMEAGVLPKIAEAKEK